MSMNNSNSVFIIAILISLFQTVPKVSFAKGALFKILDGETVEFGYKLAQINFKGQFFVDNSYFYIDFEKPEASMFQLYFDANRSTAGFLLATSLMRSKAVLYSKKNPEISFVSKTIIHLKNSFRVLGILTIRGISKKIELIAKIDSKNENTNILHFHISADIFRSDYGAGGFSGLVNDKIVLNSKVTVIRTH